MSNLLSECEVVKNIDINLLLSTIESCDREVDNELIETIKNSSDLTFGILEKERIFVIYDSDSDIHFFFDY